MYSIKTKTHLFFITSSFLLISQLFARLPGDTDYYNRLYRAYAQVRVSDEENNPVSGVRISVEFNLGWGLEEWGRNRNAIAVGTTDQNGYVFISVSALAPRSWGSPYSHYLSASIIGGPDCVTTSSSKGTTSFTIYKIWPVFKANVNDCDYDGINDNIELILAEQFKPVFHKHSYDKQEGIANFEITLNNLEENILRRIDTETFDSYYTVINSTDDLHIYTNQFSDSHTQYPVMKYAWEIDFINNDSFRHSGAPFGERPVYFHVYKDGEFYYLQYWLFFNMNDLRFHNQTKNETWHEGDWEHITLQLKKEQDSEFLPVNINFYNHFGGRTRSASNTWWSSTDTPSYSGIKQGYDEFHTHPHVWVAANSHALFNRFDTVYRAKVQVIGKIEDYRDNVDYEPSGYDLFFEYDKLEKLGETYFTNYHKLNNNEGELVPGYHYYIQGGKDWLAFNGNVGGYWVNDVFTKTLSPKMPPFRRYVEWSGFTINESGFGNPFSLFGDYFNVINIFYDSDLPDGD